MPREGAPLRARRPETKSVSSTFEPRRGLRALLRKGELPRSESQADQERCLLCSFALGLLPFAFCLFPLCQPLLDILQNRSASLLRGHLDRKSVVQGNSGDR